MSQLVLIRHAKSDYPWGVVDHNRPLNERGRRDAPEIGGWLEEHVTWERGAEPIVVISTARRAQLTWGMARGRLSDRWDALRQVDEPRVYEASVDILLEVLSERASATQSIVLVGHNPGLADLILVVGARGELRDLATQKFPTSAIAVLVSDDSLRDALALSGGFRVQEFAVPRG